MKLVQFLEVLMAKFQSPQATIREKIYSSLASFVAILILVEVVHLAAFGGSFSLLVLASMGASAFLLFVVPHSPMSQPWPGDWPALCIICNRCSMRSLATQPGAGNSNSCCHIHLRDASLAMPTPTKRSNSDDCGIRRPRDSRHGVAVLL